LIRGFLLVLAFSTSSPLCALCLLAALSTAATAATPPADGPTFEIRVILVENGLCDSSIPLFVVLDPLEDVFGLMCADCFLFVLIVHKLYFILFKIILISYSIPP
jgi:hypothetical protein